MKQVKHISINELIDSTTQSNICVDYKYGLTRRQIMEKYKIGDETVKRVLIHNHIPLITKPRYNRDFSFFDKIDTEEKAYWLGAIYADGNISASEKYGAYHSSFSSIDKDWIEMFKSDISYEGPLIVEHHKKYDKDIWKLNFGNREITRQLIQIGCTPAKSMTMEFPTLPENLVHHFIRGYFDGDGSVFVGKPTWHYKEIDLILIKSSVISGSKSFLERLVFELPCVNKKIYGVPGRLHNFTVTWNSSDTCILYDYMYEGATRYLPRKKAKFEEYFKVRGSTTIISDSNPKTE